MPLTLVSADDHIVETPELWTTRVPAKFKDDCPHVVRDEQGNDFWYIAGEKRADFGTIVLAAMPDRYTRPRNWDEVPKTTYVPAERLKAMDQDGVDVTVLFPNIAGLTGGTFVTVGSDEFRLACIRAYNDWLADEWYAYSHRFIPQCLVPMWDVALAAAELTRAVKRGHRGLIWTGNPETFGFPFLNDPYWDPLWATAQDLEVPVDLHLGSQHSRRVMWPGYQNSQRRFAYGTLNSAVLTQDVLANLLFSGILERFPRLKFISVESGVGWAPFLLEMAEHQYEQQQLWKEGMTERPGELFRSHCYLTFWFEASGVALRHMVGVDNIMWGGDFPHPTSTFPKSQYYLSKALEEVPAEEQRKLKVENATRVFHLTEN